MHSWWARTEKIFQLTFIPTIPDPFTSIDGEKVTTKTDWSCRRDEINQLLQRYELGALPPKPSDFPPHILPGILPSSHENVQENVWSFEGFANSTSTYTLPFDHHMLAVLVAPRALLLINNTSIDWLGAESVWGCIKTANKVYQALEIPDAMGLTQIGGHIYCQLPDSQLPDIAFVDKFLRGQQKNMSIFRTAGENELGFVDADWIGWTVLVLT